MSNTHAFKVENKKGVTRRRLQGYSRAYARNTRIMVLTQYMNLKITLGNTRSDAFFQRPNTAKGMGLNTSHMVWKLCGQNGEGSKAKAKQHGQQLR